MVLHINKQNNIKIRVIYTIHISRFLIPFFNIFLFFSNISCKMHDGSDKMKLSMYILENWLSKYDIISNITNGDMIIEGARLFSIENQMSYFPTQIYVGDASGFIGSMENQVICVCGPDWLRIKHVDKELIFNDILQAFDFYNSWENTINKANSFTDIPELINSSQNIFNNPLFVIDSYSNVVAMSSHYEKGEILPEWDFMLEKGYLSLEAIGKLKKVPELLEFIDSTTSPIIHRNAIWQTNTLSCGLKISGNTYGLFTIIENETKLGTHTIQLAKIIITKILSLMALQYDTPSFCPNVALIKSLLNGEDVPETKLTLTLKSIGWNINSDYCLYKISNLNNDTISTQTLISRMSYSLKGGLLFEYESSIIYLINCKLCNIEKQEEIISSLLSKGGFICGASFVFKDLYDINTYYQQAELALKLGDQTPGAINKCFNYFWKHVSNICSESFNKLKLCHPSVQLLKEYDDEHGTKFLETLYYYLRNERRLTQTSKAMFLHRNTLFYRIERIQEIMNTDMDNPDEREYIMLSLQIIMNENNK